MTKALLKFDQYFSSYPMKNKGKLRIKGLGFYCHNLQKAFRVKLAGKPHTMKE